VENLFDRKNRELFMRAKSFVTVVLSGALAANLATLALAAAKHTDKTGACARPSGRCISDCDALNWCQVYTCVNGQSTPVPFWRCFQPSGLCFAEHCVP
jgi:hypothetical protein